MSGIRIRAAVVAALLLLPLVGSAQIVNRLQVDSDLFDRYAYGRMQLFNAKNLPLADSLYRVGESRRDDRLKCLALSLEFPVYFAEGEYDRMDGAVSEIKQLLADKPKYKPFLYSVVHEYCQYLMHAGRVSDAMLEARAEQELPNLYILIAQEYIQQGEFDKAVAYCDNAEEYQEYFPTLRLKVQMTRGYLYNAEGDYEALRQCYETIVANPLYTVQVEADDRYELDVCYLRSRRLFEQALAAADSISVPRTRHTLKQGIYADRHAWDAAYSELNRLMDVKDSIYIKVQNEDMAILDAEMNNAELRAEAERQEARHREAAERLRHQHQYTILLSFLAMFAVAFFSILISQWHLRETLEALKQQNNQSVLHRHAYQRALDAKEAENTMKVKILQNRKSSTIKL